MTLWVDPPGAEALAIRLRAMAAEVDESLSRAGAWEVMAAAAAVGLQRAITQADGVGAVQAARCVAEVETAVLQVVARVHALHGELLALAGAFVRAARVLGAVEDGVANALARLDTLAHDHPDTVEWLAARGHEHALGPLLAAGERGGLLVEGPHQFVGIDTGPPRDVTAPKGLADLVADDIAVEEGDGFVRITEVTRPDGTHAWVVAISGTKVLDPRAGSNPFDVTTDVRSIEAGATIAAIGIHRAVLAAQRSTGRETSAEPILLSGHSLGGMLAAGLAADPAFRHGRNVTGVVTAGSPIGRMPVPASVGVVALEHRGDFVPRLDGVAGRTDDTWHTLTTDPDVQETGGRASRSHAGELYEGSARAFDMVAREGELEWEEVIAPFVEPGATAVAHDIVLTREWQNPRS